MHLNRRFLRSHRVSGTLTKSCLIIFFCLSVTAAWAQNYQNDINVTSQWMVNNTTAPGGALLDGFPSNIVHPYYANLGATGLTKTPTYYNNVKNYMEWYWIGNPPNGGGVSWPRQFSVMGCTVNPPSGALYGAINDFTVSGSTYTAMPDPDSMGNHHPDSTDSYAGTFLSLAYQYYQTGDPNAQSYIQSITTGAQGDRLDYVGEVVLATQESNGLTCARPDFGNQYLMDNSETYAGLRDLVALYNALGATSKANFYQTAANNMLNGIQNALWNPNGDYYWYTTNGGPGSDSGVDWSIWYPRSVAQIFPMAFGIIGSGDSRANQVWADFQCHWHGKWETLTTGDPFPWVIVGYAAAQMGDNSDANAFIRKIESTYVNSNFTGGAWGVNEAGYFIRLASLMASGPVTEVTVSTPSNCSTVGSNVNVQASATSTNGINGWHIYDNGNTVYSAGAVSSINASLNLTSGTHNLVIRAWDNVRGFGNQSINVTVP